MTYPPCANNVAPVTAALQSIPTDKAVTNVKIAQNVVNQAKDVTEHFPN